MLVRTTLMMCLSLCLSSLHLSVYVCRAMEVLDLLLTFQFNSRLESFIAKFKTADLSSTGQQRGARSLLCPLLAETFDPFDQSK